MRVRRAASLLNLAIAGVLMLVIWMLLVYVASRPALRTLIDLTPQQLNTVDPATEELLHELGEQNVEIEFHLFFPRLTGQARDQAEQQMMVILERLQNATQLLVRRYQWLGGEGVKVVVHDLQGGLQATREAAFAFEYKGPSSEVVVAVRQPGRERRFRKLSVLADLAEIRLPEMQQQSQPGSQIKVPILKRYLGEVALSSAIKSLLVQGTPVVYVLDGNSQGLDWTNESIGHAYGGLMNALHGLGFETRRLDFSRQRIVPRDAALVLIVEPNVEFSALDAQALFDYVRRGGRLFLNYAWSPIGPDRNPGGGKLGELLGYEVGRPPVFHLIRGTDRTGGRGLDGDPAVARLELRMNAQHPVTRRLAQSGQPFEVAYARELRPRPNPPDGITIESLLATGKDAWLAQPGGDGRYSYDAPQLGLRDYLVGLAIEVAADESAAPDPDGRRPGEVVIVSGSFCNNIGLPMFGDLAFNICNWMAERKVLMNIQSSQYQPAQLNVTREQVDRVGFFTIWVVPGILLLAGIVVFLLRRRI